MKKKRLYVPRLHSEAAYPSGRDTQDALLLTKEIRYWLSQRHYEDSPNFSKVIICGTSRTGTTLLQYMMRTFNETIVLPGEVRGVFAIPLMVFARVTVVSKAPDDVKTMSRISAIWPSTLFLVAKRDPRDILCSKQHDTYPKPSTVLKNITENRGHVESFKEPLALIKYEDLVCHPDEVQRELADIAGLHFFCRFSNFHTIADYPQLNEQEPANRPVNTSSIGNWRNREHREHMLKVVKRHRKSLCKQVLAEGYEEDDSWLKELT